MAKTTEIGMVTSRIVQVSAKSAKVKVEISTLQWACWMAGSQARWTSWAPRSEDLRKCKAEQERASKASSWQFVSM